MSTNFLGAFINFLAAAGLGFTRGTNIFPGPVKGPDSRFPKSCVFCVPAPGAEPQRVMGQSVEVRYTIINVTYRAAKFAAGDAKARAIQNALQGAVISGYMDIKALQSSPAAIGQDGEGNYLWSMGFQLTFEETA